MPIYEYRCLKCRHRLTILYRSFGDLDRSRPTCPHCGHDQLERLVSRVAALKSEDARLDSLADPSAMGDLDESDPKSIGRWMKKMSSESGEDLGDDFREVVDRLESGQAPEDIESAMPDLAPPPAEDAV
jgi:putative FmdB family regulatory protein